MESKGSPLLLLNMHNRLSIGLIGLLCAKDKQEDIVADADNNTTCCSSLVGLTRLIITV